MAAPETASAVACALVLSYWNVNRPSTGGLRRVDQLLRALGGRARLLQPGPPHPQLPSFPLPVDFARLRRGTRGLNWGLFDFFWPANVRAVARAVAAARPAIVALTSIWPAAALRDPRLPALLDTHDVNADAIGARFGERHPFTRLVARQEARALRRADRVCTCSALDRDRLVARYGIDGAKICVVPNGVDTEAVAREAGRPPAPALERALGGARVLFFMGKPAYQPNAESLRFLAARVLPELERRAPGRFRLLVCGGDPPPGLDTTGMVFAGSVPTEELYRCLHRADLCLSPTFTGSGTRLKVLEFMAAGKPVVATPKGAEGIEATADRELAICEGDAFAECILALDADPARARALGENARRRVADRYDWTRAGRNPVARRSEGAWR